MAGLVRLKPARPCPICGKPATLAFRPFCSARCQDVDLNRWLSESYRIEAKQEPDPPRDADEGDP